MEVGYTLQVCMIRMMNWRNEEIGEMKKLESEKDQQRVGKSNVLMFKW